MIITLCGPISKQFDHVKKFREKQHELEERRHVVLNPCVLPVGLNESEYMKITQVFLEISDAAYFLNGWEDSEGAFSEYETASRMKGMLIYLEEMQE
ncbi:MAG: DUF4406 domain-containing protein [Anaerostipes sp.]|jgi:hypothetical protein